MQKQLKIKLIIIVITALGVCLPGLANAAIIWVDAAAASGGDGSVTQPYDTIQTAIDAAVAGDEIYVVQGVYPGTASNVVDWQAKDLTLRGGFLNAGDSVPDPNPALTVIDAEDVQGRRGVYTNALTSASEFSNFTVRRGAAWPDLAGGGMLNENGSSPAIRNCVFENNRAFNGGAMANRDNAPTVENCIFRNNATVDQAAGFEYSGAMDNVNSDPLITNCLFENNTARGAGAMRNAASNATIQNTTFRGNSAIDHAGAIKNISGSVLQMADCLFEQNSVTNWAGAISFEGSSGTVVRTTFRDNTAWSNGGVAVIASAAPQFVNCVFVFNRCLGGVNSRGGVLYNDSGGDASFMNCTFYDNTAGSGNAVYNLGGSTVKTITNTLMHGSGAGQIANNGATSAPTVSFSDIEGGIGNFSIDGGGNIDADPLFVNAPNDLRLSTASPALDSGTASGAPPDDLDGNPRPQDNDGDSIAEFDMGAYEGVVFVNQPPVLNPVGNLNGTENAVFTQVFSANDVDGDPLSITALLDLDQDGTYDQPLSAIGATFTDHGDGSADMNWTAGFDQAGVYFLRVSVSDGTETDFENFTVTIQNVNRAPQIQTINGIDVSSGLPNPLVIPGDEGAPLNFSVIADDPDSTNLVAQRMLEALPPGAMFNGTIANPSMYLFSWTPDFTQAGQYDLTLRVEDDDTSVLFDMHGIQLQINNTNQPPILNDPGPQTVAEGDTQSPNFILSATDPDTGDTLTYSYTGGLGWIQVDAATGAVDLAPGFQDAGTYNNITFRVTDSGGLFGEISINISVNNTNQLPVLVQPSDQLVDEGDVIDPNFTLSASDPDTGDVLSYSYQGVLSWINVDAIGGQVNLTPGYDDAGVYSNVVFRVTDAAGDFDEISISITVANVNRPPVLNNPGDQSVPEGDTQSPNFILSATDPDTGDTLTYSYTGGLGWIQVDAATGAVDLTPGFQDSATYNNITFRVTDAAGDWDEITMSIDVQNVPQPPGVVADLAQTGATYESVFLEWSDVTGALSYTFQIADTLLSGNNFPAGGFLEIIPSVATVVPGRLGAEISGGVLLAGGAKKLMPDTPYFIRVAATNADGLGFFSAPLAVATTLPPDPGITVDFMNGAGAPLAIDPASGYWTINVGDMLQLDVAASAETVPLFQASFHMRGSGSAQSRTVSLIENPLPYVYQEIMHASGLLAVEVRVADITGQVFTVEEPVLVRRVTSAPQAALTADILSGAAPLTVQFTATGSAGVGRSIVEQLWDFDGDGQIDLSGAPGANMRIYTFETPGTFEARFFVKDDTGRMDGVTRTIQVGAPASIFSLTPTLTGATIGFAPHAVDIQVVASPETNITRYEWFVNDELVYAGTDEMHHFNFDEPGTYVLSAIGFDRNGLGRKVTFPTAVRVSSSSENNLYPLGFDNLEAARPDADFSVVNTGSTFPVEITFLDESTVLPGAQLERMSWDFDGDGRDDLEATNSFPATVSHLFEKPGTFTTRLTVQSAGLTDSFEFPVTVSVPDAAELSLYWNYPGAGDTLWGDAFPLVIGTNVADQEIEAVQYFIRTGFTETPITNAMHAAPWNGTFDIIGLMSGGFQPGNYFLVAKMLRTSGVLITKEIPVTLDTVQANEGSSVGPLDAVTSLMYDAEVGNFVSLADGSFTHLPPALSVTGSFQLAKLLPQNTPLAPFGAVLSARDFSFDQVTFDGNLGRNVLIAIPYEGLEAPESLAMYRWNPACSCWEKERSMVDPARKMVFSWVSHFSIHAVGTDDPVTTPDDEPEEPEQPDLAEPDDSDPQDGGDEPDQPPIVDAGSALNFFEGSGVHAFNGSVTDDGRSPLTIRWVQESHQNIHFGLDDVSDPNTIFSAPFVPFMLTVTFRLEATDATGTYSDTVRVTVKDVAVAGAAPSLPGGSGDNSTGDSGASHDLDGGADNGASGEAHSDDSSPASTGNTSAGGNTGSNGGNHNASDVSYGNNVSTPVGDPLLDKTVAGDEQNTQTSSDVAAEQMAARITEKSEAEISVEHLSTKVRCFEGKVAVERIVDGEISGAPVLIHAGEFIEVGNQTALMDAQVKPLTRKKWYPLFSWLSGFTTECLRNFILETFEPDVRPKWISGGGRWHERLVDWPGFFERK